MSSTNCSHEPEWGKEEQPSISSVAMRHLLTDSNNTVMLELPWSALHGRES